MQCIEKVLWLTEYFKRGLWAVQSVVPRLSLASTVLGQNRPRDTPCSSLWPPSNLFSGCSLWNQPLSCPQTSGPETPFFELNFLLLINHELQDSSELFHWGGGSRQLPGQNGSVGLLYILVSGLVFQPGQCGSGGVGHFFHELAKETQRAQSVSWKCKTSTVAMPSS